MNYVSFSLLAACCFALSQILNKLLSKHSFENKDSLMVYFMVSTGTFALFLSPFASWTLPSWQIIGLIVPIVGLFLVGYYFFFTGIFETDASSAAPLFQLQSAFVAILAFLMGIERFAPVDYLWMTLMAGGAMIVSYHEQMSFRGFVTKGIFFILLMQVCHSISNVLVSKVLALTTPVQLLFWEHILIGFLAIPFYLIKKPKMKYSVRQVAPMFLSSYVVGIGVVSLFQAFAQNLTISSVIGLLSSPLVFVISVVASRISPHFLEHHSTKVYAVRAVGLIIILVGAVQLTL